MLTLALSLLLLDPPFSATISPDTTYDPAIPTLTQIAGHDIDQEITPSADVIAYFEALAGAAPARTHLFRYGETWEGRPLIAMVIGATERIESLDDVKARLRHLAHPDRTTSAEVDGLIGDLPVVTALMHGIHGNEISSTGAAMAMAYHLLAARGDPEVDVILSESLVLIDPNMNPDGRDRFVASYRQARGAFVDTDRLSAEHDEPWPGGRTNHYLFDLNRDWYALTQPESAARAAMLLEFMPHVLVDLHEMGGDSTYFFPPAAEPGNPHTSVAQHAAYERFGRATADRFDARGFPYFTREVFDAFFPGYGVSWPTAHGALGMTFEQGSARGLAFERRDGTTLRYGDGILHHFTAALSTALTAARERSRLLRDYVAFRRDAETPDADEARAVVLSCLHDPSRAERLARTLAANGIRVYRPAGDVEVGEPSVVRQADRAFVVPIHQPAGRLVRNLLDPQVSLDPDFVSRQIERLARRQRDQIYDVTAWSLPLLWDVDAHRVDRVPEVAGDPLSATRVETRPTALDDARVGYLLPWGAATAAAVAEALRDGLRVHSVIGDFTLGGRKYGVGTAFVRRSGNAGDVPARLAAIAARHGAEVIPVDSSYVDEGTSLGSNRVRALSAPRVVLAWDRPTRAYSAGWARYVLERRFGQRVSVVRSRSMPRLRLSDVDVIALPSGDFTDTFDDAFVERLRRWMTDGGTVITMAESSRWASRAGLLATEPERRDADAPDTDPPTPTGETDLPTAYLEAITPERESPRSTPGAIARVILDPEHWLSAGSDGEIGALVEGSRVFSPIKLDRGTNVGRYAGTEDLVLSGVIWDDARAQLANKAFLVHQPFGRGHLIAFAEDPNYRAYCEATQLLFLNAVLLGGS